MYAATAALEFCGPLPYNLTMTFFRLKHFFDQVKFNVRIWLALRPGPPRPDRIIIDLSHCCDLSCPDCNRSCGADQAPADEFISLEQVRHFVNESIAAGKRWRLIMLEGGEPTLHPQIEDILLELQRYRLKHAPHCKIELCSNGYSPRARSVLSHLPPGFKAKNSSKSPDRRNRHFSFNIAPIDLPGFNRTEYGRGCYIPRIFGLGLTRSGYYPHPICGGIDRVIGLDIGLKKLPASATDMAEQMRRLCPMCGHFREFKTYRLGLLNLLAHGRKYSFPPGRKSPSWIRAYRDFRKNRPNLSQF